ncbi:MAG TPA: MFS transporter [Candidatus Eremiobacteraceae bacterium]|nr:MFS transporter [Candidatus Eremiobacteraceae bacterium]
MISPNVRKLLLLNAFWIPLNFQASAILAIAVPAALLRIPGINHTAVLAVLASAVATVAMVVPPLAGIISDRWRQRGIRRRSMILFGAAINVAGLLWLAFPAGLHVFTVALLLVILGQSISLAAYQPLIPEAVPPSQWGIASGYQGIATLVGNVGGLAVGGLASPAVTFLSAAAIVALGALAVLPIVEGGFSEAEHTHIGSWRNFGVAFLSRFLINFGLTLLMTFVLFFFNDVLKFKNPAGGTGLFGGLALVGAIVTSLWMGHVSDRVERKYVVALAGVPMTLAILGFAIAPSARWILELALLFGLGYGAFVSTGWALAIDSVPQLRDVARDLGIWGVASGLPGIIAPIFGGWLLQRYGSTFKGYQILFYVAALTFALSSVTVLFVRGRKRRPAVGP